MDQSATGAPGAFVARIEPGVAAIDPAVWDGLSGADDPFLSHAFLSLLEESGSVGPGTGWQPAPVLLMGADAAGEESGADSGPDSGANSAPVNAPVIGPIIGAAPAYVKQHSQGEYVFDHGWADAWQRAGGQYYPKLQIAVPFTPVTGRRLLAGDGHRAALIAALEGVVTQNGLSSAHATFITAQEVEDFRAANWLIRQDCQFHWQNRGYADFEDFLAALSSRKRKDLRKERAAAQSAVRVEAVTGAAILPHHWDIMWACYQDTGARKWGSPYLTRQAFDLMGQRMADRILLIIAYDRDGGQPVAGALNAIGKQALYGRYWGCLAHVPHLHFELCYYQAIDFALAHGLSRVEAGAQGGHKLARGYEPMPTYSAHFIPHRGFRAAVADFLEHERAAVRSQSAMMADHTPFRHAD
ncbi:MAG: GNAT family N-acetyltransferase [Sphingopyxis sp.]